MSADTEDRATLLAKIERHENEIDRLREMLAIAADLSGHSILRVETRFIEPNTIVFIATHPDGPSAEEFVLKTVSDLVAKTFGGAVAAAVDAP